MVGPYIYLGILVAGFSSGWLVHGWKTDSENSAAVVAVREVQSSVAKQLEDNLAEIKEKERGIIREVPKYIDRPIYLHQCIDTDGLRDINAAKNGTTKHDGKG